MLITNYVVVWPQDILAHRKHVLHGRTGGDGGVVPEFIHNL